MCKRIKTDTLQKLTAFSLLSPANPTLTESDVIQASSQTFQGKLFSEPLKFFDSFSPASYLNFCRFFLGLPPGLTIGGAQAHRDFDYPVQKCLARHSGSCTYLDATGDHASSNCPATYHHRTVKHRNLMRVIADAAQEAGLTTRCEPDTHSLLLGEFSPEECRRVFPKQMSKPYQAAFSNLSQAQDFIASADCSFTLEEKQIYIQQKIDLLPIHNGEAVGLRLDICLENMETGEARWVDTTVVHTTCASYRAKELAAVAKRNLAAAVTGSHLLPKAWAADPGPTLLERETEKTVKYSRLMMVAAKQHLDGKRSFLPTFCPFVVSDFGELAPTAVDLQEWLVNQYRQRCIKQTKHARRSNGCSTEDLVQQFRHKLKIGVQFAVASGLGNMIQAAGQPAWAA